MSLQVVVRRLAVNVTVAALLAALTAMLHAQATPPVSNPPAAPRTISVFPQRDFVSASGYAEGDLVTVEVIHPNATTPPPAATSVVPQDDPTTPEFDGIVEVNHPGGACWEQVTPDIRPGDRVRTTRRDATGAVLSIDETTVANVTATRPVQIAFDTVEIRGAARTADGTPIAIGQLEQRLVAPRDAFDLNGRRTLRANSVAGNLDGILSYDPVGPTNPAGVNWTVVYRGLDAADVTRALNAESRIMWLGSNPGAGVEATLYEIGAGIAPGPSAPCVAPLEKLPPPPGSELVPPSDPTNVTASIAGANTVSLRWTPSTDNVGVTSYGVYRNGVAIANVATPEGTAPAPAFFEDFNVPPGTYTYEVDAADEVGNRSARVPTTPAQVTTVQQAAGDIPVCTAAPSADCVSDPPAAAPTQVQIIAFPARDFTSASGYSEQDATVAVEVIRNGFLISTANVIPQDDPTTPGFDGIVEVNHPGGGCWVGATPDLRTGDIVRQISYAADGQTVRRVDQIHVANISVQRPIVVHSATAGAADGVLEVHGIAIGADGAPIALDQLNQRLVVPRDRFDFNGRRTLRAGLGEDGTLVYDAVDNADGIKFTATYTGLTEIDMVRAIGGTTSTGRTFPGAESRILFLGQPTIVAPSMTIYENSDETISGPSAGACAAPIEPLDLQPPSTPAPVATQLGADSVQLTWSPSSDDTFVNGYGIYRRDDDSAEATFVRIANIGPAVAEGSTTLSFVDQHVPAGNHTYAVDAVDSASPLKANHPDAFAGPNTSDPIVQGVEWGNRSGLGIANGLRQGDVIAPTQPANLVARVTRNPESADVVTLTWTASTDAVGVTSYRVYRAAASGEIVTFDVAGASPSFVDTMPGVTANTTFVYSVDAADAAGNRSARSASVSVVVTPKADTNPPTEPRALAANTRDIFAGAAPAIGPHDVRLSWTAASDNIGVGGYGIYRRSAASLTPAAPPAFTKIADVNGSTFTFTDANVAVGTYDYSVDAVDSAGNRSPLATAALDIVTVDDPPQGAHSIIPFPQRDFVSSSGYPVNDGPYIVTVIRGGKVWARSTAVPVVEDPGTPGLGVVEVNHPGGGCWDAARFNGLDGITPDIRPGDIVRFTDRLGRAEQTTTANVYAERVTDRTPSGAVLPPGTIQVHGFARNAAGQPIPVEQVESRIVTTGELFSNGKRTLRAPADGTLVFDPVGPANPDGVNWTATYSGLSAADVEQAMFGESRAVWLGRDPLAGNELTIFETGDGIAGGPSAPCTAAAEAGPAVAFEEAAPFAASFDPFAQTLSFGTIGTGSTLSQALRVTNVGTADAARAITGTLTVASVAFETPTADFQIAANSCVTAGIAIGASCSLTVKFTPTAPGLRAAKLVVTDSANNSPAQVFWLSGDARDASAPVVQGPAASITVGGRMNLAASSVPVTVKATASDTSGVASMQLEQTVDAGRTWTAVSPAPVFTASGTGASTIASLDLATSSTYQFRARATDASSPANTSAPVTSPTYRMSVVDDNAGTPRFQGSWSTEKSTVGAFANTLHAATAPQAGKSNTATLTFTGTEVALMSTLGRDRGQLTISVDGGASQTIDLYSASANPTRAVIVASVAGLPAGSHTVTVNVLATRNTASSGTRVDVDAFIVK